MAFAWCAIAPTSRQPGQRASSEAEKSFGNAALYVERYLERVRHVEVQVVGDGTEVGHPRRARLQPAAAPSEADRTGAGARHLRRLAAAASIRLRGSWPLRSATRQCRDVRVPPRRPRNDDGESDFFAFIEANARLQVEHTVTEQVFGLDLVRLQLRWPAASRWPRCLDRDRRRGDRAVQARINMETLAADGSVRPAGGRLEVFEMPAGPGVRVDTFATRRHHDEPGFDSLLAKVVGRGSRSATWLVCSESARPCPVGNPGRGRGHEHRSSLP